MDPGQRELAEKEQKLLQALQDYCRRMVAAGAPRQTLELPPGWLWSSEYGRSLPELPFEWRDRVVTPPQSHWPEAGLVAWVEGFEVPIPTRNSYGYSEEYVIAAPEAPFGKLKYLPGYLIGGKGTRPTPVSELWRTRSEGPTIWRHSHTYNPGGEEHGAAELGGESRRIKSVKFEALPDLIGDINQFTEHLDLLARHAAGEKLPGWPS